MIYGSIVDYYLEPKIAYYFLRRAYEPVIVSFEKTADRIGVWVINDSPQAVAGTLTVERLGFDGKVHGQLRAEVAVNPGEAKRCLIATELGEISLRSQFLHATFAGHDACCLLISERYVHLPETHLGVRRVKNQLEITTDNFARQVTLRFDGVTGAVLEDNFFDLLPGQKKTVGIAQRRERTPADGCALNAESIAMSWDP